MLLLYHYVQFKPEIEIYGLSSQIDLDLNLDFTTCRVTSCLTFLLLSFLISTVGLSRAISKMTIERVERGDACKALRTKLGAQQRVAVTTNQHCDCKLYVQQALCSSQPTVIWGKYSPKLIESDGRDKSFQKCVLLETIQLLGMTQKSREGVDFMDKYA